MKLLYYLTITWCYNLAKSFKCCVLNLLPSVLPLIPVLVLLIASLTILICLQLILVWFQMAALWLHMLQLMFQANLNLQVHAFLSSLKLLDPNLLFLVCFLLFIAFSSTSPIFPQSNRVEFCPMKFRNHKCLDFSDYSSWWH